MQRILPVLLVLSLHASWSVPIRGQHGIPEVLFMEPVEEEEAETGLPLYRQVADEERIQTYRSWLQNPHALWALDLFSKARAIAVGRDPETERHQPAAYYVALVPGGNHGDLGFRLQTDRGIEEHPGAGYIKLGPDQWRFDDTFLHETGHVVTYMLSGGRKLDARPMTSLPHTTASLSDRETAFREGYSIHLEALMARLDTGEATRDRYFHEQMLFGRVEQAPRQSEYYHHLVDLLNYAQTVSRYHDVLENTFAFQSAWKGPDYFRVQLEKTRDYAELRDANQLLQSEGFYASFFYALLFRGLHLPPVDTIRARQGRMLEVKCDILENPDSGPNRPYLLEFLEAYQNRFPGEYDQVLDVFLDLTHGVFVDRQARSIWRRAYLAALALDMQALGLDEIEESRRIWRERIKADSKILYRRLGPELPCMVRGPMVEIALLGPPIPLYFDINTVQEGILCLIPGLTDAERLKWLSERESRPFSDFEEFTDRVPLSEEVRSILVFDPE